ncbi:MAG: hypothetical protein GX423_10255 [Nitrospiraceae bacterium]|jgi:hypothetical protein|nr:hypothetical protein [Nitrospiraceae bacterium]
MELKPSATIQRKPPATEEQLRYARLLRLLMRIGLIMLIVTYAIYMSGILTPRIPVQELSRYWSLPVHEYLSATGLKPGWSWVQFIGTGDYINFSGVVFLAAATIWCYAAIFPMFLRKKDYIYAAIAALEILVLVAAASGILQTGGH